jgi:hypothetical protein
LIRQTVELQGEVAWANAVVCRKPDGQWALSQPTFAEGVETVSSICPRPGTVVETSLGGHFNFTHSAGARCWFYTPSGEIGSRFAAFLAGDSSWAAGEGERLRDLFPLQVGKEISFTVEGATDGGYPSSWDQTYTVTRRERVTVPAGTFDTYVVRWREQGRLTNDWEATHTFWFSPDISYIVKFRGASHTRLKNWQATRVVRPDVPTLTSESVDRVTK